MNEKIEECSRKIRYHNEMENRCSAWDFWLSLSAVACSGLQIMVMSILSYTGNENLETVGIVGTGFGFILIILNKTKDSYSFLALKEKHKNMSNMYNELKNDYMTADIEDLNEMHKLNVRLIHIQNRDHIQHVRNCKSVFCCLSTPE